MRKIINDIFKQETEIKSFFKKYKKDEFTKNKINQLKSIMKKWFPNDFKYNYCDELLEDQGYEAGLASYFYILYKNKLYRYKHRCYYYKVCNIELTKIYIINPPYYKEIKFYKNKTRVNLFKYLTNNIPIITKFKDIQDKIVKRYCNKDNIWQNTVKTINTNINNTYTGIYEYYIITYEHIYDNDYNIYHYKGQYYKKIHNNSKYGNDLFRFFKLFI